MVADSLAKLYFVSSLSELWDSTIPEFILTHIVNNMSIVSGIKFRCSLFFCSRDVVPTFQRCL